MKSLNSAFVDYNEEVNRAPAFFSITYKSLILTLVITTAKLFDSNNPNTKNILKLLNRCASNITIFPKELQTSYINCDNESDNYIEKQKINVSVEIENFKKEYERLDISALKKYRNKIYAHNDKEYFIDKSDLKKMPLKYDDIEELLEFANEVCNRILVILDRRSYMTQSSNIEDVFCLLSKSKINNDNENGK